MAMPWAINCLTDLNDVDSKVISYLIGSVRFYLWSRENIRRISLNLATQETELILMKKSAL